MKPTREEVILVARGISNTPLDAWSTPDLYGESQILKFAKHFYEAGAAAAFVKCLELADNCADADMHASMAANAIRPYAKATGEKT